MPHSKQLDSGKLLWLVLTTSAVTEELWQYYFDDLVCDRLDLQSSSEGILPQTLQAIFNQLHVRLDSSTSGYSGSRAVSSCVSEEQTAFIGPLTKIGQQILSYHVSFYIHNQYIMMITPVLRQLDKLQTLMLKFSPSAMVVDLPDNPLELIAQPERLCSYTCELLFAFLRHTASNLDNLEGFHEWYKFYQNMVSLPTRSFSYRDRV